MKITFKEKHLPDPLRVADLENGEIAVVTSGNDAEAKKGAIVQRHFGKAITLGNDRWFYANSTNIIVRRLREGEQVILEGE